MKLRSLILFIVQSVTVGLALAFLVLMWRPELFKVPRTVVEFHEALAPTTGKTRTTEPVSYADGVAVAAPAVVNIYTRKVVVQRSPLLEDPLFRRFFGAPPGGQPQKRLETSLGSGVILNTEGYVVTNNHVVAGADEIQVALRDGRNAEAQLIGSDPESDLAVLKIGLPDLPTITLGRSDDLRVGDVVLAIGNPFGVGQTVTLGIASATGRNQLGINTFENFIQTDAAINPGNSGGALINTRGELLGINTAIFSRTGGSQGIGFAIPVSLAKGVMRQIIEQGHVSRGWLGVEIQALTQALAESFGLQDRDGVLIAGVLRNGPADKAGLQPGDVITHIQGKKLPDVREALNAIAQIRPGTGIDIKGVRNGKAFRTEAVVAERPLQQLR